MLPLTLAKPEGNVMKPIIAEDMPMSDVMRKWPETIRIVLRYRMLCVGCPIAPFHTIADACREHGVDQASFLNALNQAVASVQRSA